MFRRRRQEEITSSEADEKLRGDRMTIYFIGVIVSIIVYLLVGIWAGKNVKDTNDYYVSGRNGSTLLIAGTLFASMLSVTGFMGDQGFCYSGNITTMVLLNTICACGYIAGPLVFGRYLRRSECNTMPEYFGKRYQDPKIRRVAGVITIISLTAYLLSSITGGRYLRRSECNTMPEYFGKRYQDPKIRRVAGVITIISLTAYLLSSITGVGILMEELTGLSYEVCLFLAWLCFTGFTFYSGSKGVILTDTMMFLVFLFATMLAGPYIFQEQGGIGSLVENLMNNPAAHPQILDYHGNIAATGATDAFGAVMYAVTMGIVWMITVSVSPWQAGRNMMAKSEHVTFRAGAVAAICTTVFLLYLNMESVAVINIKPDLNDPQRVAPVRWRQSARQYFYCI